MKKQMFAIMAMGVVLTASAFSPNTKWPYINEHFAEGTVYCGVNYSEARMNIHLAGNVLHYISPEDDKIYTAKHSDMDSVVIAGKKYVQTKVEGKMMEVVAENAGGMVMKLEYGDFDALAANTGAYGASLNSSSSRNLISLDLAGMNNQRHGLLLQEKNDGKDIPVRSRYYLRVKGMDVEANKKSIELIVPADKEEAWKAFLKKNKIKWKNPESLLLVLAFFK